MNAFQSGRDDDDDETDEMNCLSLNFGELLIIEFSRELPPDQAEYCIQRMQPYSGMDAVQVSIFIVVIIFFILLEVI